MIKVEVDPEERRNKLPAASYSGSWGGVFFTAFWGMFATAATAGFYIFWVRRRLRTYYWSHTQLLGDEMDYKARALQSVMMYLILGLGVANYVLAVDSITRAFGVGRIDLGPALGSIPSWCAALLPLMAIAPYVKYRAQRYFVNYVYWRRARFRMGRGALEYAARSMLWFLAQVGTLGLITPIVEYRQRAFMTERTNYAGSKFQLGGSPTELYRSFMVFWGACVALVAVFTLNELAHWRQLGSNYAFPGMALAASRGTTALEGLLTLAVLGVIVGYYWHASHRLAFFIRNTTIGDGRLSNEISGMEIFGMRMQVMGGALIAAIVSLGLAMAALFTLDQVALRIFPVADDVRAFADHVVAVIGAVFVAAAAYGCHHTFYHSRLMGAIATGLSIQNPDALGEGKLLSASSGEPAAALEDGVENSEAAVSKPAGDALRATEPEPAPSKDVQDKDESADSESKASDPKSEAKATRAKGSNFSAD